MIYIGIDPHVKKDYAFSVWDGYEVRDFGHFQYMCEFYRLIQKYNPNEVLVEDQYLSMNYKTAKQLSYNAGKIFGMCEYCLVTCTSVNVATWQSKLKLFKDIPKDLSAYHRKKLKSKELIKKANVFIGVADDDEASAVLIPYAMRLIEK